MTSLVYRHLGLYRNGLSKQYKSILLKRFMSMHKGAYDGDGRTTVTILNKDPEYGLMIDGVSCTGFRLNIGLNILGAMIIFPKTVLGWNIASASDIHKDSLTLFKAIIPRPDIMILGLDDNYPRDAPFIKDFRNIIKDLDINVEILPVIKACTTFNFLNSENRYVVGALLPPRVLEKHDTQLIEDVALRKALRNPVKGTD
ncbi:NADH dehydrogenase [ubiquinone] 1 alpha subcomplex assembly factor 3 [Microplitis mediator]|uniref:NADH dehydrogenase [ubiquinone] 1 alpha subcomplex assembly factor 3 n=1 Tax=Microplitis mediator TaxID=375433 RepID=UPI002554997B|nr:NADH dehydrogenase [ubiquinone] 1 alpha subcomplex assembly factor 3 [Microplitis mediator]